ncbi:glycosyltransferase family 4 protein [Paenibacillus faecis]|uniref:Glycosyltransferase family 4 protein n=1 Tax=Paenibacillus faecis TaxID=862114 RepID=A0A5D0CRT3_9BACL|nr:glycosyltransferase family 4 protein [Paenibacillus faecis]TYA12034.1 glycosyltransferase family 4 protein [Paenibacillus faecis]
MLKKVLFCATVVSHLNQFHTPYMRWFKQQGWEVHAAAFGETPIPDADCQFSLSIERSPFRWNNLKAYKELADLIKRHGYHVVHCHTPMGGVLTRLAARQARRSGTKVLYTAHGFHFFDGAPIVNWLLYYPAEKLLSRWTDCLITINEEDYLRAIRRGFKAQSIVHVHGVGVDFGRFKPVDPREKQQLRREHHIGQDRFVLIYAAELSKRKNQGFLLQAAANLKRRIPELLVLLAGQGDLETPYKRLAQRLGLTGNVVFLGQRKDMPALYALADVAVTTSRQEGLPVNVMEALASGLPMIATEVRGNRDLVEDGINGYLVRPGDTEAFEQRVWELYASAKLRKKLNGRDRLLGKYTVARVLEEMTSVYRAAGVSEGEDEAGDLAVYGRRKELKG